MIQFANKETRPFVRSMWKTVFEDKDEYIELIFSTKYSDENTLIYFEKNEIVASLQMYPYKMRFFGETIDIYYLAGLCTLPEYRNKGYMGKLIIRAFEVMLERKIPLSILVPAEDWLFGYYEKYGYVETFKKGKNPIDLDSLIFRYPDKMDTIFTTFEASYQHTDFTVLKTKDELQTILEEYIQDNRPSKYNLRAMSRIIDTKVLLNLYAKRNPDRSFIIRVNDEVLNNNATYKIEKGSSYLVETGTIDFDIDVKLLTKLLFGFQIEDIDSPIRSYFEKQNPVINLMLE